MANGNEMRIYDMGKRGALILQAGEAYSLPAYQAKPGERANALDAWAAAAPGEAAPAELTALVDRLGNPPPIQPDSAAAPAPAPGREASAGESRTQVSKQTVTTQAPVGCSNGCCDYDWMYNNLSQCNLQGTYSYRWMFFNSQCSSWADGANSDDFQGLVCAAVGQSKWTYSIGGQGHVLYVPQAHYLWAYWTAGYSWLTGFDDQDIISDVNKSPYGCNLHTYCGGFQSGL
jgi:hypothetical protein